MRIGASFGRPQSTPASSQPSTPAPTAAPVESHSSFALGSSMPSSGITGIASSQDENSWFTPGICSAPATTDSTARM